jgi:Obg family GTPase CgtA-like protein
VHIVDITQKNPMENYEKINAELRKHSQRLADLYQIVALNKIDALEDEYVEEYLQEFKKVAQDVFIMSAATGENIDLVKNFIAAKVDEIPKPTFEVEIKEDLGAYDNDDSSYEIVKADKNTFIVFGGKIKRLASVTDARNLEQVMRLQNIFKDMGIFEELKNQDGSHDYKIERVLEPLALNTQDLMEALSGGQLRRAALARALVEEPDILLLDEPTRGIDVGAKFEIYKLITELAKEGKAVLMISSEMEELIGVCDRIYVMAKGRISGELARKDFSQENIMKLALRG